VKATSYTFRTVEMWIDYRNTAGPFGGGQYILDARTGAGSGFWISSNNVGGTDNVGTDLIGSKLYLNYTLSSTLTSSTPDTLSQIYGTGWTQLVLVLPTDITDDITFLARYTDVQGPYNTAVADCALYNTALTSAEVKALFNSKCSRYGLAPIP